MRHIWTRTLLSTALAVLGCSKNNDRSTTPPPGQEHATYEGGGQAPAPEQAPAEGAEEATGMGEEGEHLPGTATEPERQPVGGRESMGAGGGASANAMTDENIVAALTASNQMEVKMADMVASKTKNAKIKQLATMLVTDHTATLKKLEAISSKHGIQPSEDANIRQMKEEGDQKMSSLQGMSGKALDQAFLENMIDGHQKTLAKIDDSFLPNVKNEDLRSLISDVRPVVQRHLEHAIQLRDKMKK